MAQPELRFQSLILESVRELGGAGIKMSNRFQIGVSDLLLQLPTWPIVIAEVKLIALPRHDDDPIKIDLKELQRDFLSKWQSAGAHAGLIIANRTNKLDMILCTRDIHEGQYPTKREFMQRCLMRPRGTPLVNLLREGLLMPLLGPQSPIPSRFGYPTLTRIQTIIPRPSTVSPSPA